jgi:hypothetical protein
VLILAESQNRYHVSICFSIREMIYFTA